MMINIVKAKKMLSKGCITFLVHIVNKIDEVVLGVRDTPMVQNFSNVFLNNFPKLTPEREVKFNIELALDITLM